MTASILWFNFSANENRTNLADEFNKHVHVCVENYATGVAAEQINQADLLCFEFDFPDISSLDFLKQARRKFPHVPVMMVSMVNSAELAIWALRMQVWEYLVAPVDSKEVKAVAESLLGMTRAESPVLHSLFDQRRSAVPVDCRYLNNRKSPQASVAPALNYVNAHLHEKIREEEVARLCNMSPFKFSRAFKRCYGRTFQEYVISQRLDKASQLLLNPNVLVVDVAHQVGFRDPSYFTRLFKKHKGISPSDCRDSLEVTLPELSSVT